MDIWHCSRPNSLILRHPSVLRYCSSLTNYAWKARWKEKGVRKIENWPIFHQFGDRLRQQLLKINNWHCSRPNSLIHPKASYKYDLPFLFIYVCLEGHYERKRSEKFRKLTEISPMWWCWGPASPPTSMIIKGLQHTLTSPATFRVEQSLKSIY